MKCTQCGQQVDDNSPAAIALKITASKAFYWGSIEDVGEDGTFSLASFGIATMVARSLASGQSQGDDNREAYLVFELNGNLYRKDGIADSYGDRQWIGTVKPVTVREKLVKTYEYVIGDES